MKRLSSKASVSVVWVVAMGLLAMGATSISTVILLGGLAVVLPVVVWRLWQVPSQSLSESIHEARR
jgi:hypothetical protein